MILFFQFLFQIFINIFSCSAFDFLPMPSAPLDLKNTFRYSGVFEPKRAYTFGNEPAGIQQESVGASIPVYKSEKNGFLLSVRGHWLDVFSNRPALPDLYEIQFGGSFIHLIEEKKVLSFSASFGSASDKPFKDTSVDTVSATGMYSFQNSATSSWILLLSYSNNRSFLNNIPLPGFAYSYFPKKEFRFTFGLPFASVYWQFIDRLSLNAFILAPWIAKVSVGYSLLGPMQVCMGFDFSQSAYLLYGRSNLRDRWFYDEKKVFLGFKTPLTRFLFADLESGYAFNRRFFSKQRYTPSPSDAINFYSSWYAKIALNMAF